MNESKKSNYSQLNGHLKFIVKVTLIFCICVKKGIKNEVC